MLTVGVLTSDIDIEYTQNQRKMRIYRNEVFANQGIRLVIVDMKSFDIDKKVFTRYRSQGGDLEFIEEDVSPSIIRVRTSNDHLWNMAMLESDYTIFPPSKTISISLDKWYSYLFYKEFHPWTTKIEEFVSNSQYPLEKEYILKPRIGYGGSGVEKMKGGSIKSQYTQSMEGGYIVQQVCDFSGGIQGITNDNHDLRLVYIGGRFSYAKLRTNQNNFKANWSSGGVNQVVTRESLPQELLAIASQCVKKIGGEDSGAVGLDFGYDSITKRRVMIEMNYSSGFSLIEIETDSRSIDANYQSHIDEFKRLDKRRGYKK